MCLLRSHAKNTSAKILLTHKTSKSVPYPSSLDIGIGWSMWANAVNFKVKGIAPGKTCHLFPTDMSAVKCYGDIDIKVFPGFRLKGPDSCQGKAVGDYCRGKGIDEECTTSYECDVGLMCGLYKKCVEAGEEGQFCNDNDRLCKSYLFCKEGICIRYGSIKNHVNPGNNNPELCESHYIYKGVCAPAPRLDGPIFVEHVEDVCDYDNGHAEYAKCGFHKDGKAICKPGEADLASDWRNLLEYLKKKPECNPALSYLSMCDYGEYQLGREYLRAAIGYWKLHHFVELQENAECAKPFTWPAYFDLVKRYGSATSVSLSSDS